jgi:hypothetical protein
MTRLSRRSLAAILAALALPAHARAAGRQRPPATRYALSGSSFPIRPEAPRT